MQVESFLEDSVRRFPDKTALICGLQRLSYAEVDQGANRLANDLIAAGIEKGDRVAVYAANSAETVLSIFAILKAGAVFVVINPSTKAGKLSYVLNHCAASGVICDLVRYSTFKE